MSATPHPWGDMVMNNPTDGEKPLGASRRKHTSAQAATVTTERHSPKATASHSPSRALPGTDRHAAIVSIAAELFLQRGYAGVSIDAINTLTGGSKRDIYTLFGDKETLFQICVETLTAEQTDVLERVHCPGDLRPALISISRQILDIYLAPRTLALRRLIVADHERTAKAAQSFLSGGARRIFALFAGFLRPYQDAGVLKIDDIDAVAKLFVGGLTSDLHLSALLGHTITEIERDQRINEAVDFFLRATQPR